MRTGLFPTPVRRFSHPTTHPTTPFLHHVATLAELQLAAEPASGKLYTFHFNALRSIIEKTASFFGHADIGFCLKALDNEEDRTLYNSALNLILRDFTTKFQFDRPAIVEEPPVAAPVSAPGATP